MKLAGLGLDALLGLHDVSDITYVQRNGTTGR